MGDRGLPLEEETVHKEVQKVEEEVGTSPIKLVAVEVDRGNVAVVVDAHRTKMEVEAVAASSIVVAVK